MSKTTAGINVEPEAAAAIVATGTAAATNYTKCMQKCAQEIQQSSTDSTMKINMSTTVKPRMHLRQTY